MRNLTIGVKEIVVILYQLKNDFKMIVLIMMTVVMMVLKMAVVVLKKMTITIKCWYFCYQGDVHFCQLLDAPGIALQPYADFGETLLI